VLIVDESAESQQVLGEMLIRRGAVAVEARRAEQAADLTRQHRPNLIVFDTESDHSDSQEATRKLVDAATRTATPVLFLGSVGRHQALAAGGQIVAKPYHYGQLLRRIDDLLAAG
jgi:DNA-binding response OmpR family regulator